MSPCADMVGWPVEGPPRWTLTTTQGVSVIAAKPMFSIISEKPGPLVAVIARAPVQEAPMIDAIEAISSSIWMKTPPFFGKLCRHVLGNLGRWGDRVPAKETTPCCKRPFRTGRVALPEFSPRQYSIATL